MEFREAVYNAKADEITVGTTRDKRKELQTKVQLYDNAKEDLELAQAVRWFNNQPRSYRDLYTRYGWTIDFTNILRDWREQNENEYNE